MAISIGADLLSSYYASRSGGSALLPTAASIRKIPTAPWEATSTAPKADALVRSVLAGRKFVEPAGAQLDVRGASEDYRKLFGLYQGLNALAALADRAGVKGITASEKSQVQAKFAAGMAEVGAFVDGVSLEQLRLVQGQTADKAKAGTGVPRSAADFVTRVVQTGSAETAAAAFAGEVRFNIKVEKAGVASDIAIDLNDMGGQTRSLANVLAHVNGKLQAAGLETRILRERVASTPARPGETAPERWAMKVVPATGESVAFSAPQAADAVYLVQSAGKDDVKAKTVATRQLLKFQTDVAGAGGAPPDAAAPERPIGADANWVAGRSFAQPLGAIDTVRATATAPDGSVYVLGEAVGTVDGQALQGRRDAVLTKYDSAGNVLFTRTLGAADEAQAGGLAVSADGHVAVVGRVVGALSDTDAAKSKTVGDSFVTLYDAAGEELWTRRAEASGEDEATAVAFAADGTVVVGGRTKSPLAGQTGGGGWDGYLRVFGADGKTLSTQSFGGVGDQGVSSVAVRDGVVIAAGTETGRATLRRFDLDAAGAMTAGAVRDLGELQGGAVAGVAFDTAGALVVAGSTGAALDAGSVSRAYTGGRDGFVAKLDVDLVQQSVAYLGGEGQDSITALTVTAQGDVYVAGSATTDLPGAAKIGAQDAFLARLDPGTGDIGWMRRYAGQDGQVSPAGIAVASGGASVLDRLGLPSGPLDLTQSKSVVAGTSARAGDSFQLRQREGGRLITVTLAESDTLATLADKVNKALGSYGRAEVVRDGDVDRLQIRPRIEGQQLEVLPGKGGADLLASLGLSEGLVQIKADAKRKSYGLKLDRDLTLNSDAEIKRAIGELATAMSTLKTAFRDLKSASEPAAAKLTGEAPAYLKNQLANYQAALSRLTA